jgi:uncharacterized membrane protein
MPETVFGLPVHPLVVHATVMMVPLAALLLIATVLVPRLRAWAGPLPLLLALGALTLAPVSTASGENLEEALGTRPAISQHAAYGEMLVWWCLGLVAVAAASWFLRRRGPSRAVTAGLAVAGVVVGVGAVVQVALTGHSGAEAVWSGRLG